MEKENDIVLNMLANPNFGVQDFQSVGLKAENTELLSEDDYLKSEKITSNDLFKDTEGNFDSAKFHNFYLGAGYFYNKLSQDNYNQTILEQAQYSKDNMWVRPEKRTIDYTPKLVREPNEHLINTSLTRIGKKGKQTLSDDEIAQTQKVYNTETGEWTDSPNDSFFSNFFTPLVRATYDEDEYDDEGNIVHQKGERKLNDDGLPYYETLGGRNISGKNVLNKMNILTKDGSTLNKFDFFDSDDIEQKSVVGSVLKNAALVGSMFIPYIGPVVTGLSVLSQTAGLIGTFGKMAANLTNSDDSWANELEGWSKSVSRNATTQYAAENTWCWENFFNLIGDSTAQLAEQRWIFKAAPVLLMGPKAYKAMSTDGRAKLVEETAKQLGKQDSKYMSTKKIFDTLEEGSPGKKQLGEFLSAQEFMQQNKAYHIIDDLASQANKIGSPISKAYMIGLTVGDTYQEAKDNGATDLEAALLTVGYAIGETAILNSELGEWILPELHNKEFKNKAIAEALLSDVREAQQQYAGSQSKKGLIKTIVNIGKKIASRDIQEANLRAGSRAARMAGGMIMANALGESFEEVSEEALADASKALFNVTRWLRGQEGIDWHANDNVFDRYAMSAIGGFIGGGIASAGTDFVAARHLASMDKTKAMQELLYMVNNNMEGDFLKSIDKMTLGNKHLSAKTILDRNNESGQVVWAEGTDKDNQDLEVKTVLRNQVNMIKEALDSEGARLSTNSLISKLTMDDAKLLMRDMRFNSLQNSSVLGLYLQDYQNIQSELVRVKAQLNELEKKHIDSAQETAEDASLRQELTRQLEEIRTKKNAYTTGTIAPQFIRDAIYEMNPVLHNFALKGNLQSYAKFKTGKNFDDLSDAMKKKITEDFEVYQKTEFKDDVHAQAQMFDDMMANASPIVEQFKLQMQQASQQAKIVANIYSGVTDLLKSANTVIRSSDPDDAINTLGTVFNLTDDALAPERDVNKLQSLMELPDQYKQQIQAIRNSLPADATPEAIYFNKAQQVEAAKIGLLLSLDENLQPIVDAGYLHPEAKAAVLKMLDSLESYAMSGQVNTGNLATDREIYTKIPGKINEYRTKIEELHNTPILEFLSSYQSAATNSKVNLMDHWKNTMDSFANSQEDISDFGVDEDWEANNDEFNKLVESFAAVVSGMRTDNADFGNLTSYSHIMNEVNKHAKVDNVVQYAEIEGGLASQVLQDLSLIKSRMDMASGIAAINKGQKLKQQVKVGTNTNHLLYKSMERLATTVLPDDDDDAEIKGGKTLKDLILNSAALQRNSADNNIRLDRQQRYLEAKEMVELEHGFYEFFKRNNTWTAEQLGNFLNKFAGSDGFFNRTGQLLTDKSTSIDDNSFIWWMAARAALDSIDFHAAYNKALDGQLAAIPSQELATYLGVASITNMDTLNKFVDAYRHTVVQQFKSLDESKRQELLQRYKGSRNGDAFASSLLEYFAAHDSVPQYHNMIFIEGGPGTGKSKGVDKMIANTIRQIDPSYIDNAMYVHATNKSAQLTATEIGLKGEYKSRTEFLQWISPDWKDARMNKKDGKSYLYDESYEFTKEGLVNKWALNAVQNPHEAGSTTPKVIFVDEISHYNQQELSMMEQFARQNQIIIIASGDLNQDTFTCYATVPGLTTPANVTISRNNFIRTQKLGVSLRTLNKQMTGAIRTTQSAFDRLASGETASLQFNYHEGDQDHPGLFGVKVVNPSIADDISDAELQAMLPTIQAMIDDLQVVDGEQEKIGYIYSSSNPNTKLHKYLTDHFSDKVEFFADSDAQGLEGKYYIVDIDRRGLGDANVSEDTVNGYLRSLYTGVTRAEKGVLAITPGNVGNIESISSIIDPKYQQEDLGERAIKRSAEERKQQLEDIFSDFDDTGITPNTISIQAPAKYSVTVGPTVNPAPTTNPTTNPAPAPAPLPPPITPPNPEPLAPGVFVDIADATLELNKFTNAVAALGTDIAHVEVVATGTSTNIASIQTVQDQSGNYYNKVTLTNGAEMSFTDFINNYTIKAPSSQAVLPKYTVGQKMVINIGGTDTNVEVVSVDTTDPANPKYELRNIDDGSTVSSVDQDTINFVGDYIETTPTSDPEDPPITGFENESDEYETAITAANIDIDIENIDTSISHQLYTHATFETGVVRDAAGNIQPLASATLNSWMTRIDSMIGLSRLTGNTNYDVLLSQLGLLKNYLNTKTRSEVESIFNNIFFGGNGVTKVDFAFKSSYKDKTYNNKFDRFAIGADEELQFIESQDPKAKLAKSKKLVAIFNHDGKNVLEIPIGVLNSPLTLMQYTYGEGNCIYTGIVNGREVPVYKVFTQAYARTQDMYEAINEVINTFSGQAHLNDLMDLFNVFRYTSNGIFYLPKTFELSQQTSSGPELIDRRKGNAQLDNTLWWDRSFSDIAKFADHPQRYISSIFMSRDGTINGTKVKGLHPGHSFVLVSNDNDITTDNDLVKQYEKQIFNPAEPKKVKLFYVVPPKVSVSSWLRNLHNVYRNKQGENLETWAIGNNFTSYNILRALINSGHFNDPEYGRPDELPNKIIEAVDDLRKMETKWQETDIQFSSNTYNGIDEKVLYEHLVATQGAKAARRAMLLKEQMAYLQKQNTWGLASTTNKTIEQCFNYYLTNQVWPKPIGSHGTVDPAQSEALLAKIDRDLYGIINGIHYRAKYGAASNDVGSFARVLVKGTSGADKFNIPGTLGPESKAFRINSKIDTPTFTLDRSFNAFLHEITQNIYFNGNHWYATGRFKNDLNRYLDDMTVAPSDSDIVANEYASKFADGTLNNNLLDPYKSKQEILVDLARDFSMKAPNQYGFVHNGQLILTKFSNPGFTYRFDTYIGEITNADQEIHVKMFDQNNNPADMVFWFDVDNNGFINQVHSRCTTCQGVKITNTSTVEVNPFTAQDFSDFITNTKNAIARAKMRYGILQRFIPDGATFDSIVAMFENNPDLMDEADTFVEAFESAVGESNPVAQALRRRIIDGVTGGTPVSTVVSNNLASNMVLKTPLGRCQIVSVDAATDTATVQDIDSHDNIISAPRVMTDFTNVYKEIEQCATINWARI